MCSVLNSSEDAYWILVQWSSPGEQQALLISWLFCFIFFAELQNQATRCYYSSYQGYSILAKIITTIILVNTKIMIV